MFILNDNGAGELTNIFIAIESDNIYHLRHGKRQNLLYQKLERTH